MDPSFVYGLHAVKKMLQHSAEECEALFYTESKNQRLQQVVSLAQQKKKYQKLYALVMT